LVNSKIDLFFAALAGCESKNPAPAAVVRRKSRRVESGFILFFR
jgi:hypothetical protein